MNNISISGFTMNNKEAWDYLQSKESERASALSFVIDFQLNEGELSNIRYKFSNLKSTREYARKKTNLPMWEDFLFYSFLPTSPPKKRLTEGKIIIESDLSIGTKETSFPNNLKRLKYDSYLFDEIRVGHISRNKFFSL